MLKLIPPCHVCGGHSTRTEKQYLLIIGQGGLEAQFDVCDKCEVPKVRGDIASIAYEDKPWRGELRELKEFIEHD